MKKFAIIVAGGKGTRMESEIPKQFLLIKGLPVLMHTIIQFYNFDNNISIIVPMPSEHFSFWEKLCTDFKFTIPHQIVAGGNTRFHSVKNGLALSEQNSLIAIHDGVRPLISIETIERCFNSALENGNAIPVIDLNDSIRYADESTDYPVGRSKYKLIQTPQVFKSDVILKAYNQDFDPLFTDDASVVEKLGITINLIKGNTENIKITNKTDLIIAGIFITRQAQYS